MSCIALRNPGATHRALCEPIPEALENPLHAILNLYLFHRHNSKTEVPSYKNF